MGTNQKYRNAGGIFPGLADCRSEAILGGDTVPAGGGAAPVQKSVIQLYSGQLLSAQQGRKQMPFLREMKVKFIPTSSLLYMLCVATGASSYSEWVWTITVFDDDGESYANGTNGAPADAIYSAKVYIFMLTTAATTPTTVIWVEDCPVKKPDIDLALSEALSVDVNRNGARIGGALGGACLGTGALFDLKFDLEWRDVPSAEVTKMLLGKQAD